MPPIVKLHLRAPQMLAAVGLEAIDAEVVNQIGALVQPPVALSGISHVPQVAAAKPERANPVQAAIRLADAEARLLEIGAVGFVLRVRLIERL